MFEIVHLLMKNKISAEIKAETKASRRMEPTVACSFFYFLFLVELISKEFQVSLQVFKSLNKWLSEACSYRSTNRTQITAAHSPCFPFSSRLMASGGHGLTTSVSKSLSRLTRRRGDSSASRPWTTQLRLPAGLCSEPTNKVLILLTHASNDATKPKTFQDADG